MDGNSSSSVESVSNYSDSCSVKEYDFNREQYGALASKNLKELVGRRSDKQSSRGGFGEMYKELLNGARLSLMSETDWRRLIEKKEVNYSQLTDYYKRQVHRFYEEKGRHLLLQINKLVVSAYGKCISLDKKRFSEPYCKYIKIYGKQQFLDRTGRRGEKSSSGPREKGNRGQSGRMTGTTNPATHFHTRQNSASADKNSALKFRRFGKNRAHYKRVIRLLLEYFAQVKEFAYKLDRHLDLFLQINPKGESSGWFQFKSMVYSDLMRILFRDSKVAAFLSHLHCFFERNHFYASRFRSVRRKLAIIDNHLVGFARRAQPQVDSVKDGKQIIKACHRFRERKKSRRLKRSNQARVAKQNRVVYSERLSRISSLGQRILACPKPPRPSHFDDLHQSLKDCFLAEHELLFCQEKPKRPSSSETRAMAQLSTDELSQSGTLESLLVPWFTHPIECVDCQRIFSLVHLPAELGINLPKVERPPDEPKKDYLGRSGAFPRNRESQAYSLTHAKIVQDDLKSPNHSRVRGQQSPAPPNLIQNVQTFKKRKRKKRRKKAKNGSASLHKMAEKGEDERGSQCQSTQLFAQLSEQSRHEQSSSTLAKEAPFEKSDRVDQNSKTLFAKEKQIQKKTHEMLWDAMQTLEVWTETAKKLRNKRRKDERFRKKGQRRNKKMRMNEDLKAMKAYQEWEKMLSNREVGHRKSVEGVWNGVRKSLLIQKRF